MDWIAGMQKALDYIEDNITEELDYEEISKQAYVSSFHFQRVFSILCGYTIGEYIRNRRLTLAGAELSVSSIKVIDVALKYGYETSESFTRAFTRFHGITPSSAREQGAGLKSFSRLSVNLSLKGGTIMNYRIEEKRAFKIIAKTERFSTEDDSNKNQIPKFWDKCHTDGTIATLCAYMKECNTFGSALLGVCEEDSCEAANDFPYSIGCEYCGGDIPKGLGIKEVPSLTWAIFQCVGSMPHAIQDGWHKIYAEFFPTSEYKPVGVIDFEVYPAGNMNDEAYVSEIWIPVEKK